VNKHKEALIRTCRNAEKDRCNTALIIHNEWYASTIGNHILRAALAHGDCLLLLLMRYCCWQSAALQACIYLVAFSCRTCSVRQIRYAAFNHSVSGSTDNCIKMQDMNAFSDNESPISVKHAGYRHRPIADVGPPERSSIATRDVAHQLYRTHVWHIKQLNKHV
jgi:hypothetical protein